MRDWLLRHHRPGFYERAGQPWVDWEAWARGIREGWITEEGYWNGK